MFTKHSLAGFASAAGLALVLIAGAVGVTTGSASAQATGPTFLAASNRCV